MSQRAWVVPLMVALAGCASAPDPARPTGAVVPAATLYGMPPVPLTATPAPVATRTSPTAAGWAVSIIGTPFALVFKTVVCGASLVLAAPAAGFLTLGVDPSGEGYEVLGDGIAQNCGPPYVVSPYAAS